MLLITNLNLIIGCILVGLIWTIQVVHYPLFKSVKADGFVDYMKAHQAKISLIVIPLMGIELISSSYLFFYNNKIKLNEFYFPSFYLVIAIWVLTFFVHMPQHRKLLLGYDGKTIRQLVATNWLRTIFWTIKIYFMFQAQSYIYLNLY